MKTSIVKYLNNGRFLSFGLSLIYLLCIYMLSLYSSSDRIIFLDVGEGDATLIYKGSKYYLVDGGPNKKVLFEMGRFMRPWERKIDAVIITHPHADHISGLRYIIQRFDIGSIVANKVCFHSELWEDTLLPKAKQCSNFQNIPFKLFCMPLGKWTGACYSSPTGNVNNDGIVISGVLQGKSFLIMGDAEIPVEKYLIRRNLVTSHDILRAGHHCSKTSSSLSFVKMVKPSLAICSVGRFNRFHHPSEVVIDRFNNMGAVVRRTDVDGSIEVK